MRIDRIDLWHVAVGLPAPFRPAWIPGFVQTENRFDLIRLTTASGIEGWSAAPRMGRERAGLRHARRRFRLTLRLGYPIVPTDERIPFVEGLHCDLKHPETFLK